jgi:hypothetical protein
MDTNSGSAELARLPGPTGNPGELEPGIHFRFFGLLLDTQAAGSCLLGYQTVAASKRPLLERIVAVYISDIAACRADAGGHGASARIARRLDNRHRG